MDNNFNNYEPYVVPTEAKDQEAMLQTVMSKTFIFMSAGLLISALCAFATYHSGVVEFLRDNTLLFYGLLFAELLIVIVASSVLENQRVGQASILFIAYACINGVTLSSIFLLYTESSILSIFILAALLFGVMAIYGYVTKSDLTRLGSIGMMGLFGVIILGFTNIFIQSSGLDLILSMVGLAIFIGLTAFDMQKIKEMATESVGKSATSIALFGALQLYLDFINIFLRLLRLFGKRD